MNILILGDIIGKPGRTAVKKVLPSLIEEKSIDFVIANGENVAGGIGINPRISDYLLDAGIDVITTGNHVYKKKEIYEYIEIQSRLLKPANYPPGTPGKGFNIFEPKKPSNKKIAVINLCGRVFISELDCPFRSADKILEKVRKETNIILVDFHAEVTSEKIAMGWYLDGRVSAVIGTHTHVQTADEKILYKGTAYITDVGMVGPQDSVIGVEKELIIERFKTQMPQRFVVAKRDVWLNGVIIELEEINGQAISIERLNFKIDDD